MEYCTMTITTIQTITIFTKNDQEVEITMKNPLIQLKKIESKNDNIFTI